MCRIIIEGGSCGPEPEWAVELEARLVTRLTNIDTRLESLMALTDDLAQAVSLLTDSEDSVLAELDQLVALAQQRGSVSDADVQAAVNSIRDKVSQVNDRIAQINTEQQPAPSPEPEPAPEP
jgi:DNA repair ATPase RecN